MEKRRALVQASGEQICCDSWDDTLAHIIGLGEAEYLRNIEEPRLILEREQKGDYLESFPNFIAELERFRLRKEYNG